ncbi:MAG TPA: N-acetylmuramoyl-L-alanine amidase [Candidatus Blautia avistercoris]|uniref:N-acetylmuramoyl-L-alanine amidase n=1 Tax=Blautia sp. An249 TaxID=1965603 RepID=UPI000B37EA21|nr:N-acetylmuramoyl-L-alanine amidase [Blautia sp. An249]OUO80753.1 N-acetylmuramoyl-L-alanine amidase [Blautia sp. An249]HIY19394.1 N-acetylmuramoyl-L-alanine amidase [Candidatus Blautia avistercoris]
MKRKVLEMTMSVMLLLGFFLLSQEAASAVSQEETAKKIVIDAGHGGRDPGMVGTEGVEEKGINLAIAQKLENLLEENGFEVIMTRDSDEGLYEEDAQNKKAQDMQRRCEIIKEAEPLLTVSIHQNSYSDPSVKGPQVFYYQHSAEGEKLASFIQNSMNEGLEAESPKEAKANDSYYLLKRSEGVLNIVECGFLTNPEEALRLQEEDYQQKIAGCIYEGIMQYLEKM